MRFLPLSWALFLVLTAACKVYDPLYCDSERRCTDPERPFCDLHGDYPASEGIAKTCIPWPYDAGSDGGFGMGDSDASASADAAPPGDAGRPCSWGRFARLANVNSDELDYVGSLTPDGLTLYFARYRSFAESGLLVATRDDVSQAFGNPIRLDALTREGFMVAPEISFSGLELFFPFNGLIYVSTRDSPTDAFTTSTETGIVGSNPSLSGDGLTLYFAVNSGANAVIYKASRPFIGGPWSEPVTVLPTIGHPAVDVSPDELRLLVVNDDDDAPLAIAERRSHDDEFGAPVPLDSEILVKGAEYYLNATWDASQTHMVVSPGGPDIGLDMYYSVCQ